jgi:hypothetical protein
MGRWWKVGLAALVGAAIAVPVTVFARGGLTLSGNADGFALQAVSQVQTQGKGYTPVGISLPGTTQPISATVSATMTKGKAKFRLVSAGGNALPSSALFSAKASNSFTFGAEQSCPPLELQWKRQGDSPAVAAQVSVLSVFDSNVCVI